MHGTTVRYGTRYGNEWISYLGWTARLGWDTRLGLGSWAAPLIQWGLDTQLLGYSTGLIEGA